ncbi:hypothetical protein A4D02_07085 [Niastella koreensis]|uniref:Flotillin C-terminal domain-containing protein n=1 Tax=Niastella koreensis TaxID=354356 RepID=A0ABX3NW62_9BACT|nr:hypothetical protein [Niastella koreensis]OQP48469.1 hypothetical protein A4D02_07085 [Niastella koreensis]
MIAVAEKDKEILIAAANRDEQIGKVEADRDTRIKSATANSVAVQGENLAKILIADSEASRREREAEARGMYEILTKQAEGLERIVKAAGNNPKDVVLLLISDKLPELVKMQTDAIRNIRIDKITVWENGQNGPGKSSTANFVSGLYKAVPPLKDIFDMAGMDLPGYLVNSQKAEES